jgi:hypothetical protein
LLTLRKPIIECFHTGLGRYGVQDSFESEVAFAYFDLQFFQFDVGHYGGEEMIGLGLKNLSRRAGKGRMLLELLVVLLYFPLVLCQARK